MGSIARNFDIGAQIHQDGLNILSARTYHALPALFERRQEVVVDAATGRELILYLFVTEPLAFDFYPAADPAVAQDQFSVQAKIEFTLTDQFPDNTGLGLITRIKATLYAIAGLDHNGNLISPGIQEFQVKDLTPDSPFPPHVTTVGALDVGPAVASAQAAGGPPLSTSDAFKAILNYLISVFLLKTLQSVVAKAPLPQISLFPQTGRTLYLRGLSIETKRATVYLEDTAGGLLQAAPGPPPEARPPHLAVGAVQDVLHRILSSLLPLTLPVSGSCDDTNFFQAQPSTLTIPSANFDLQVPDVVNTTVFVTGNVNFNLNVTVLGYHIQVGLSIPLGSPTFVKGTMTPFCQDNGDGTIDVRIRPTAGFFQPDLVVIATDWRDAFKEAAKQWVRDHVSPVFKWIPFIGWVVSKGVEEIAGDVAGALGGMLDQAVSIFLTIIGTLAFQIIAQWFSDRLSIKVYTIDQKQPIDGVPLGLQLVSNPRIDPNANGELIVEAWLFPEPAPSPLPAPQIPGPEPGPIQPPPAPCHPAPPQPPPTFPSYADGAFQPALILTQMPWQDGEVLVYDIQTTDNTTGTQANTVSQASFHSNPNEWHLTVQSQTPAGSVVSNTEIVFDTSFGLKSEQSAQTVANPPLTLHDTAAYNLAGRSVTVSGQVNAQQIGNQTFATPNGAVQFTGTDGWMFFLMANDLRVDGSGNFARTDINVAASNYINWTRFVPQVVRVLGPDTLVVNGANIATWKIEVSDEQFIATVWIELAAARRPLRCEQRTTQYTSVMQIR